MEQLREISRQHYLEKREEKELKLLELGKCCLQIIIDIRKQIRSPFFIEIVCDHSYNYTKIMT